MEFINLTPHPVSVVCGDGTITFPPSGGRATLVFEPAVDTSINGFVIRPRSRVANVTGLPDPQEGVLLIVSTMVREAMPSRTDLVTPDSGPDAVRENGQILYVRRFIR